MSRLELVQTYLRDRLPALLAEHRVPGAAVAVAAGGEIFDIAAGVLSKATEVEATTDSVFQIGSITKVWTSTLEAVQFAYDLIGDTGRGQGWTYRT